MLLFILLIIIGIVFFILFISWIKKHKNIPVFNKLWKGFEKNNHLTILISTIIFGLIYGIILATFSLISFEGFSFEDYYKMIIVTMIGFVFISQI